MSLPKPNETVVAFASQILVVSPNKVLEAQFLGALQGSPFASTKVNFMVDPMMVDEGIENLICAFVEWTADQQTSLLTVETIHDLYPQLPILVLAPTAMIGKAKAAVDAGALTVLPHPLPPEKIPEVLRKLIKTEDSKPAADAWQGEIGQFEYRFEDIPNRDMVILRTRGQLDFGCRKAWREALSNLEQMTHARRIIDIYSIQNIHTVHYGSLVEFATRAKESGRQLIIRVNAMSARVAKMIKLDEIAQIIQSR